MMKRIQIQGQEKARNQGSALLVTLLAVALLMVVVLSFVVMVRQELRTVVEQQNLVQARAHARLGLQLALGELQRAAGPDRRSVARAALMHKHARVGGSNSIFPAALGTPADTRSLWVGVSHSDGNSAIGTFGEEVVWLVSGLDRAQTPAQQLAAALPNPVNLITVRATPAAGSPPAVTLRAGRVPVRGPDNTVRGNFAWLIDDETQKAKLAPSTPARNSEHGERLETPRTVLPGFFNLSQTTGLISPESDFFRAARLSDLAVTTPGDASVANERYFDYTFSGYGVLSDTRNGGLKRDLTAAYENPAVFNALFPNLTDPPYIAMDMDKFHSAGAVDLRNNGYIHHGVFRDFYTLKDRVSGNALRINTIDKNLIDNHASASAAMRRGTLGPHQINDRGHPYGQFTVWSGIGGHTNTTTAGAHNPITPVFAFLQQNAWIQSNDVRGAEHPRFTNFTELWTGIYNPYNVALAIEADGRGPMFRGYPMPRIFLFNGDAGTFATHDGSPGDNFQGFLLRGERWIWTRETVRLHPGRTQIFGFGSAVDVGQTSGARNHTFSKNIAVAVNSAANRARRLTSALGGAFSVDMLVEMSLFSESSTDSWNGPSMAWGLPAQPNSTSPQNHAGHEIAQVFYMPFTKDLITNSTDLIEGQNVNKSGRPSNANQYAIGPGVQFYRQDVPWNSSRMSPVDEAVYEFKLRTSTERTNQGQLRPLVDSNIRAIWNNPKWDTHLGLNSIATHTFITNKSDDTDASSVSPDNLAQPSGNEAFLSYGNSLDVPGSQHVILFDIPREPLVSIGQLQHAAAGRFSYEPTYIAGNSHANIRLPLNNWFRTDATDTYSGQHGGIFGISGTFSLFDASYLVNEALFDGYAFTTIPQTGGQSVLDNHFNGTRLLQNPRHLPHLPSGFSFDTATLQSPASGRINAGFVLIDGAFNVNSTSVEAWEVFLSGTKGLPYRKMDPDGSVTGFESVDGVRFPRVQTVLGVPWESVPNSGAWFGFRQLTPAEVRSLAEEIVRLIQERGPFHNLSEFINRRLSEDEAGKSGLLQAALDAVINSTIPASFERDADRASFPRIAANSTQGAGFPTQLQQGDILQALAPFMQTRSDTFTIRTYGELIPPGSGGVVSRAWGEAVVQRLPDPVQGGNGTPSGELALPSSPFGRRFEIVAFRWLDEDEI